MNTQDFHDRLLAAGWNYDQPPVLASWQMSKGGWWARVSQTHVQVGDREWQTVMCWPLADAIVDSVVRLFARRYSVPDILSALPVVRAVRSIHPSVLALRSGVYGRLP